MCVLQTHLSSLSCQLLSQCFQLLFFTKQLLIVSLSQRLKGKNPLKQSTQHAQIKTQSRYVHVYYSEGNPKILQWHQQNKCFTSSSLLLSELGGLMCRLARSSIFLRRWAFSCLSLSSSTSAFEGELLDLKPNLVTMFSLAPLDVMAT